MAITKEELQSMRTAGYLIEPPAGDVINNLADEIDRLCTRIAELEAENCKIKQEAIISITAFTNRCAELSIELTELREVTRPMTVHAEGWTP